MVTKLTRNPFKTLRKFFIWLVASSFALAGVGCRRTEGPRCPNSGPPPEARRLIEEALQEFRFNFPQVRPPGSVKIPVYFHILTSSDGKEGRVSPDAIQLQIRVLNAAFAGNYGAGAATPFTFEYVATDTEANDTWFKMQYEDNATAEERAAKAKLNKGGKGALNIYTAKVEGDILGWGRFPWNYSEGVDGVVVRYTTLPGGIEYPNNEGDTATHEVGHWLGLFHTYEGNCGPPGDSVDDTPPGKDPAKGCPNHWDSCPQIQFPDAVHNYMNATNDQCMNQFTRDQSSRMDGMHLLHRT